MISYANLTESTSICKRILIHYAASMSCVVRGLPIRFRYFRDTCATHQAHMTACITGIEVPPH